MKILISACLLGITCRYDGGSKVDKRIINLLNKWDFLPICPEQLGGLPTPRPPAKFLQGDGDAAWQNKAILQNENGDDVLPQYLHGAKEALKIAHLFDIRWALFKEKSPSCGPTRIHQNENYVRGMGITASLCRQNGIAVFSEEQLDLFLQKIQKTMITKNQKSIINPS